MDGTSSQRRILIVDDEEEIRSILADLTSGMNFIPTTAEDGAVAKDFCDRQKFDIILTDLAMPKLSGLDFLSYTQAKGIDTPVVLLTAYSDKESALSALRLGAFDFLMKPFRLAELENVIYRAAEVGMRRHRLTKSIQDLGRNYSPEAETRIKLDQRFVNLSLATNHSKKRVG